MKPEDIGEIFKEAFRIAREGRPGPVLIDFPSDMGLIEAEDTKYNQAEKKIKSPGRHDSEIIKN